MTEPIKSALEELPDEIYVTRHERIKGDDGEIVQSGAWCSKGGMISAPEKLYRAQTGTIVPDDVMAQIVGALSDFCDLYGHLWDSASEKGAGYLSPESVTKYDTVHAKVEQALAAIQKIKGE